MSWNARGVVLFLTACTNIAYLQYCIMKKNMDDRKVEKFFGIELREYQIEFFSQILPLEGFYSWFVKF